MRAVLATLIILGTAALAWAQPATPAPTTANTIPSPAPATIPEWVARYAGLQEQAARACLLQLSQEQTKTDDLTKQLADARSANAKAAEAAKK